MYVLILFVIIYTKQLRFIFAKMNSKHCVYVGIYRPSPFETNTELSAIKVFVMVGFVTKWISSPGNYGYKVLTNVTESFEINNKHSLIEVKRKGKILMWVINAL